MPILRKTLDAMGQSRALSLRHSWSLQKYAVHLDRALIEHPVLSVDIIAPTV